MGSVPAPEYLHTLAYVSSLDIVGDPMKRDVRAAYFVEEGALTLFKNREHHAVFALRTDMVLMIERGKRCVDA